MRRLLASPFRTWRIAALALSLSAAGCTAAANVVPPPASPGREGAVTPTDVTDDAFAAALHRILRDGGSSPERLGLLTGVVRRQFAHAAQRFATGHDAAGTSSVVGALYLLRTAEGRAEMIDAVGAKALAGAADRVAVRGDEGRALALMTMRRAALAPGSKELAELDEHLAALDAWMRETHAAGAARPLGTSTGESAAPGTMRRLGAEQRTTTTRALLDPSAKALEDAASAIDAWVALAIKYQEDFRHTGRRPEEREDGIEVQRALISGGPMLAAIFLHRGDAKGAAAYLDASSARDVIPPALLARIHSAALADDPTSHDWHALAGAFASHGPSDGDSETDLDPELIAAGEWGTALEAYRRDPANFDMSVLVARSLLRFGLPEAAPLVMADALVARATPPTLGFALSLVLEAVTDSTRIDDLDTARRTFRAARSILEIADKFGAGGGVDPSPARARAVMASVEVRAGNLAEARSLLRASMAAEPSISGYTTLALVERQAGDSNAALGAVQQAVRIADARSGSVNGTNGIEVAEARLLEFELYRDGAAGGSVKSALDAALTAVLAARRAAGTPPARARAEQLLARILEGYGDAAGSKRAFDRAMQIATVDREVLGSVMLDAISRALVRRDLATGRAALARGLEADVSGDDLVYGGLWVSLLERELHAAPDGTADHALRAGGRTGWTTKLSAWAAGKLSDNDLGAAAQNASQHVEAAFYAAMGRRAAGDPSADERLRKVAGSPAIDLLEVQIARDMLAPRGRTELPAGVKLP